MTSTEQTLDPWWAAVLEGYARLQAAGSAHADAEEGADPLPVPAYTAPDVPVTTTVAPGPHGGVPLRIYGPGAASGERPLLVWCHGGAWVGGDLDMPEADATAREVCARADSVVVSVDYRLAREGTHFPVPHDDVVAAVRWAAAEAEALGASPHRLCLGGASAGGNLAAGAALRLRDEGGPMPASLALVYPALHGLIPSPSAQHAAAMDAGSATLWPEDIWRRIIENYLGTPVAEASPYALPALADLALLPPTLVITCEVDPLRSSGDQFASALADRGVEVSHLLVADTDHAHINEPWRPEAQRTYADLADWVERPR